MENFSPDDCFDEMAKVLMPERVPSEVGYIELLEEVKKLKEDENQCWKAIAKNKTEILMKYLPDYNPILSGGSDSENIEGCLKKLLDENKKLKELTEGIMEEEGTEHILGINAYEKFCQAICELNHDEEWIKKLKAENKKLQKKAKQVSEIKDFLKCCDRNTDGYYEHYETRQLAIRVEGELKSLVVAKSE
jgi:hypothetical protein